MFILFNIIVGFDKAFDCKLKSILQ